MYSIYYCLICKHAKLITKNNSALIAAFPFAHWNEKDNLKKYKKNHIIHKLKIYVGIVLQFYVIHKHKKNVLFVVVVVVVSVIK